MTSKQNPLVDQPAAPNSIERIPAVGALGNQPRMSLDRPARPLTYELANHAKAYLEAGQYVAGYSFLDTLLTTNTSIATPAKRYHAYLAQAPQLALASTLIVYPNITTKAKSAEQKRGSDMALRYLHNVQCTISPLHEDLRRAFSFPDERSRRGTLGYRAATESSPASESDLERLTGAPANENSLWFRATDFWHAVGWAFNCSVAHKKRWERWKLWLDVMLNFLEAGWEAQARRCRQQDLDAEDAMTETLLWQYISSEDPMNRSNRRRIIRAILARGTSQSKSLFPEVWPRETAEPKQIQLDEKSVAEIDIDNGNLGEFQKDDDDEAMADAPTATFRTSRRATSRKELAVQSEDEDSEEDDTSGSCDAEDATNRLGGVEAVGLRQRLIVLLVKVAQALPMQFTHLGDLFDPFTEECTHLPTMLFSVLLSTSKLDGLTQTALNANHLLPLVSGQLPDYTKIEPTQAHLEQYMLPRRAATQSYSTNAKISLILEQIFLYMMSIKGLHATATLRAAVEKGIQERTSVYGTAKGKKGNAAEEEQSKMLLEASSKRLLGLLEVLEIAEGMAPQPKSGRNKSFSISFGSVSELSSVPGSEDEDSDREMR
ncbi:uncharacterized protein EI97DRAFT_376432 [Westerdykella ornata]|uniref:Uncharacterized protein n=1 Tax=Westerdykella ornata TaxID=318751 RepID=A0A6A6JJY6_WESOR|nr:uncharacterized protein EI97DRAFT_376432 [Westerdykella ornata]KAF2276911.1 hypothetical protein EI97DRAFT_376432 [Westerdykella ornata]